MVDRNLIKYTMINGQICVPKVNFPIDIFNLQRVNNGLPFISLANISETENFITTKIKKFLFLE